MTKIYTLFLFIATGTHLSAQQSLNTTGNSLSNSQLVVQYSIGQIETTTLSSPQGVVTQGLLQPDPVIDCSTVLIDARRDSIAFLNDGSTQSFIPAFNDIGGLNLRLRLLDAPANGQLNSSENPGDVWTYQSDDQRFSGLLLLRYEACHRLCPVPCDTGIIVFNILGDIPNIITPNGDGLNDTFDPLLALQATDPDLAAQQMVLMNRSGEIIQVCKPYKTWDARTKNGRFVATGTYFFRLELTDGSSRTGPITVLLE